jgi:alpha-amylase/alpha-mannosidase (GH57 family)
MRPVRALCLHGHFYQPPREHPWLGVVEPEPSAAPHRDWNARVTAECYEPNAAARVLDRAGRLAALVDTYEWCSFDFGPTLLSWLAPHAPEVFDAVRRADTASRARTGHGNAWAQAYSHPILPLSTPRDVRTQVLWGRADFEHRFGRAPEGMWLPEMAVDLESLSALARAGIPLTMLASHQARRVRPLGAGEDAWREVTPATLDVRRLYRCRLPTGGTVDVVFRDPGASHDVAFGPLLDDGAALASRLREAVAAGPERGILAVASDGETYGHHHRFGEMALAFALRLLADEPGITLTNPAAFRDCCPPTDEVEIVERTSWSCVHGVERWQADCGCKTGGEAGWTQAWRKPLRAAIDWLRDELAELYESRAGEVLRDPWAARDRYVACLLDPARTEAFLTAEAGRTPTPREAVAARRLLELARNGLLMQTSCGWFFDELVRIEPVQVLRYAARAIELAEAFGARLEDGFCERLAAARSNLRDGGDGARLYRRAARGQAATPARVAATAGMLAALDNEPRLPGWEVRFAAPPRRSGFETEATVREATTGAESTVGVAVTVGADGAPVCRVDGAVLTLADLFGVQRETLLIALGRDATVAIEAAGHEVVRRVRPLLDALLTGDYVLPSELASLIGLEGVGAIAAALDGDADTLARLVSVVREFRRRGVRYPAAWLAGHLTRALEARLGALPGAAPEALAILELAEVLGTPLDVGRAQVVVFRWWRSAPRALRAEPAIALLAAQLGLAPEAT